MRSAFFLRTAAAALSALLLSCGADDSTRTSQDPPEPAKLTEVRPAVNVCPRFEGSFAFPRMIPLGAVATVGVRAVDPDADDLRLTYSWSASSGEFSAPESAISDYRCDAVGEQLLTAVARDEVDCDAALNMNVICVAE